MRTVRHTPTQNIVKYLTFVSLFDKKKYIPNSQVFQFENASSCYKYTITWEAGCFSITLGIQRTLEMMYEGEVVSKKANESDFYNSLKPATFELDSFHW